MHDVIVGLTIIAVLVGTAFSLIGVIGFIRLPDVYTRLHATGKVSVFGVVLLLVAATLLTPLNVGKAVVLILLLVIGGPTASHALAAAAWRVGIRPRALIRDDLGPPDDYREPAPQDADVMDPDAGQSLGPA